MAFESFDDTWIWTTAQVIRRMVGRHEEAVVAVLEWQKKNSGGDGALTGAGTGGNNIRVLYRIVGANAYRRPNLEKVGSSYKF